MRIEKMHYFDRVFVGVNGNMKMKITCAEYMDDFLEKNSEVCSAEYVQNLLDELKIVLPVNGAHSLELMKKEYNTLKNAQK